MSYCKKSSASTSEPNQMLKQPELNTDFSLTAIAFRGPWLLVECDKGEVFPLLN
jgi:hypothetical protein